MARSRWVWVDLENTPHVHFLKPFVDRLRGDGLTVRVTARPQAQTLALSAHLGIPATPLGWGDFHSSAGKILGVLSRSVRLIGWVLRRGRPDVLLCCSRSASLAARLLGVPGIVLLDYEHAELRFLSLARTIWFPDILRSVRLPAYARKKARFFSGLKENLYLDGLALDREKERAELGLDEGERLVVSRPPAETAHYASDGSWALWNTVTRRVALLPSTRVLIMPRTAAQGVRIRAMYREIDSIDVLTRVVDGPRAIAAADLVIGGGGTINREAAVLGTPVWSVFLGPRPHIDDVLADEGRLWWVHDEVTASTIVPPETGARERRGPFPEGFSAIMADIRRFVDRKRT